MRDRGDWKIRLEKNFIGNRFFFAASPGRRISFHWKRVRKRKKVGWNWNQARRGAELRKIRKSVEKKGREVAKSENRSLFKLFFPGTHRRKLAVAINKGAEFEMCATRQLERNGFFFSLSLSLFQSSFSNLLVEINFFHCFKKNSISLWRDRSRNFKEGIVKGLFFTCVYLWIKRN